MQCGNCGAPALEAADGRSLECRHCGAVARRAIDPSKLAAALRREGASIAEQVAHLADALAAIVPEHVAVTRAGVFAKRVTTVIVTLGDAAFHIDHTGTAQRKDLSGGIALKTHALAVEAWLRELAAALSAHAAASERAHAALLQMI